MSPVREASIAKVRSWAIAVGRRLDIAGLAGCILLAFLGTIVALLVVGFVPILSSANRAVAIGDVFGAGIFLLAFIAAGVSLVAYAQSSRRPETETTWTFRSLRDGAELGREHARVPRDAGVRPPFSGPSSFLYDAAQLIPLEPVMLDVTIKNSGEISGRYVTVVFFLKGIYFDPMPIPDPGSNWRFIRKNLGTQLQWEGGLNSIVYRGIPRTPSVELTGMWALAQMADTDWGRVITVADEMKKREDYLLRIDPDSP